MRTNLKVILSAAGVAALLASPALAKSHTHQAAPSTVNVPYDARASVATFTDIHSAATAPQHGGSARLRAPYSTTKARML